MTETIIALAAVAAAAYLLRPLFRGRRRGVLLVPLFLAATALPPAAVEGSAASIGLLLIAVDVQRDHLRVSEAMRLVNAVPPRELDLTITLPPGAVYLTSHRGLHRPVAVPGGFRDRLTLGRGVSEVIYSYALPAGRQQTITRTFPLRVERMEIVVRGRGVGLTASRGQAVEALDVGGDRLPRWEVRGLHAGESLTFIMRGLPVSRPWFPLAAAGIFAVVLAGGLTAAAGARPAASPG